MVQSKYHIHPTFNRELRHAAHFRGSVDACESPICRRFCVGMVACLDKSSIPLWLWFLGGLSAAGERGNGSDCSDTTDPSPHS